MARGNNCAEVDIYHSLDTWDVLDIPRCYFTDLHK